MKITFKPVLTITFCAVFFNASPGQQTGSFETTVSFLGQNRTLSCHVPANYDPSIEYRVIIGLHGLGDNSINYRNALINSLSWSGIFDSTIFIFPDGGNDQLKDFYDPAGDEAIIAECINYAKQNYSIDTTDVILQGFSLGGRSALKYGLDNPGIFKGLLLNTPALQGLLDVDNIPGASLNYNYANSPYIPMYITVGSTDFTYTSTLDKLINLLKKNNAKMEFVGVNGLGHTMPNNSIISPCIPFFEDPSRQDFDLEIFEIEMKERSCNLNLAAGIYVRNLGGQNINTLDISYEYGGSVYSHTWSGNIGLYEHAFISLPQLNVSAGVQSLDVSLGQVNGGQSDPVLANNQLNYDFEIVSTGLNLPVNEGFEANETGWIFEETGSLFEWAKDNSVKLDGQSSIFAFNTILVFNTLGASESFNSPVMDLSSVNTPYLAFNVAYNYHQYTPPFFTDTVNFADTLEVLISTDCGETFQSIYKEGGADLATTDNPILNPLSVTDCFFIPSDSSEWRREKIDLSAYSAATEAVIKFSYISALGGSINIDNIDFDDASVISVKEPAGLAQFEMFPNPATDKVQLYYKSQEINQVEVYSLNGALVYRQDLGNENQTTLNLSALDKGMYLVKLIGSKQQSVQKLNILR